MGGEARDCFGKFWEERHPECAGGLDATYKDPSTGSCMRQRCDLYEQCSRVFKISDASNKMRPAQAPPGVNLIRPSYIPQQPRGQQPLVPQQPQYAVPTQAYRPQYPAYQAQQPQYAQAPQAQPGQNYPAVYHPVQILQNNEAPKFLTQLEDGESPIKNILMEGLRAAAKGIFQHGAFVVDHSPSYFPRR
jgi:hypothetical protein